MIVGHSLSFSYHHIRYSLPLAASYGLYRSYLPLPSHGNANKLKERLPLGSDSDGCVTLAMIWHTRQQIVLTIISYSADQFEDRPRDNL